MSSELFQTAHDNIKNTGERLLQYTKEVREGLRTQGDKSQGLQSIEEELNKTLSDLQHQKYQVAVVAPMKAGKSTFLNAIIGADILASETAACTVCRTDVQHINSGNVPRLLEYQEGQREPILITEGNAGEIRQKFLERTHNIRESGNASKTVRFELKHTIDAISTFSSLAGFTLIDTPGPNEWKSATFDTSSLKETALEALRNCNAVLFLLNYGAFKDNAINELFEAITENRQELLQESKGRVYFILNQVDRKTEKDPDIAETILYLEKELLKFGFPDPLIYPASALQGLLAKLIKQGQATDQHKKDFRKFFSAKYAVEDDEGGSYTPPSSQIAPQSLADSGIPKIQETVLQTITQTSGWNFLSDVLLKVDKSAEAIESVLKTKIAGWNKEIEELRQIVEEYTQRSNSARKKVETVKKSVDERERELINRFVEGINLFAEGAKKRIQDEIDRIADSGAGKTTTSPVEQKVELLARAEIPSDDMSLALTVPNTIPLIGGFSLSFRVQRPLVESLRRVIPESFLSSTSAKPKNYDPYMLRFENREDAQKLERTINEFCNPHIRDWWIDTQDQLVRQGTTIREYLVQQIQEQIQQISNELSSYLGKSLQVDLKINPIQFPSFEFEGIDAQVQDQFEVIKRKKKQDNYDKSQEQGFCEDDKHYLERIKFEEEVEVEDQHPVYLVDLSQATTEIKTKIDSQAQVSKSLLQRVIHKQVTEDFRSAEKQINEYIDRFQSVLEQLLKDRETKEAEKNQICAMLEDLKAKLIEHLVELASVRETLNSWKPSQTVK